MYFQVPTVHFNKTTTKNDQLISATTTNNQYALKTIQHYSNCMTFWRSWSQIIFIRLKILKQHRTFTFKGFSGTYKPLKGACGGTVGW